VLCICAQGSREWLLFQLAHPLCLVRSIAIRPFRAFFQRVRSAHPSFSPKPLT
jgi:hypothetical protein